MVKDVNEPVAQPSHDEKAVFHADTDNSLDHAHNDIAGSRRQSVAANIIHNPLTVSYSTITPVSRRLLTCLSASQRTKTSSMLRPLPRAMA